MDLSKFKGLYIKEKFLRILFVLLILALVMITPVWALQCRFNALLSGYFGLGIGLEQELDPLLNLRASLMAGLDPVIPIMMEANFQRFLSGKTRDRQFVLVGLERVSGEGQELDFVKFGWGLRNPYDLSERFEIALIAGYFLKKSTLDRVGINLSYQI